MCKQFQLQKSQLSDVGPDRLVLRKPDDFHLHVRDGEMLKAVVPVSAESFGRCIIMPNTVPPITTAEMVTAETDSAGRAD